MNNNTHISLLYISLTISVLIGIGLYSKEPIETGYEDKIHMSKWRIRESPSKNGLSFIQSNKDGSFVMACIDDKVIMAIAPSSKEYQADGGAVVSITNTLDGKEVYRANFESSYNNTEYQKYFKVGRSVSEPMEWFYDAVGEHIIKVKLANGDEFEMPFDPKENKDIAEVFAHACVGVVLKNLF